MMWFRDIWRRWFSAPTTFDPSRRGVFRTVAGGIAAAALAPILPTSILTDAFSDAPLLPDYGALYGELAAFTRKAFIPNLYVQLYAQNPMLAMLIKGR